MSAPRLLVACEANTLELPVVAQTVARVREAGWQVLAWTTVNQPLPPAGAGWSAALSVGRFRYCPRVPPAEQIGHWGRFRDRIWGNEIVAEGLDIGGAAAVLRWLRVEDAGVNGDLPRPAREVKQRRKARGRLPQPLLGGGEPILAGLPPLRFVAPLLDVSGYGEASRHQLWVLGHHGADVYGTNVDTTFRVDPENARVADSLAAWAGAISERETPQQSKVAATIYHLTPDTAARSLVSDGSVRIGAMVWETNKLHAQWVGLVNQNFNRVWVPTVAQAQAFRTSGIRLPVHVVPFALDPRWYPTDGPVLAELAGSRRYTFYTVGQWHERKNLTGLIHAYLSTFTGNDPVQLVIKAYVHRAGRTEEIKQRLAAATRQLRLPGGRPAPIMLITRHLSRHEMLALHRGSDCYVSLHRGEGWGLPIHEALLLGRPAIVTGYGAPRAFGPYGAQLVPSSLRPVHNMTWIPWYTADQLWAEPDLEAASAAMRQAASGDLPPPDGVARKFSTQAAATAMLAALKEALD